jgi:hypothetical protein
MVGLLFVMPVSLVPDDSPRRSGLMLTVIFGVALGFSLRTIACAGSPIHPGSGPRGKRARARMADVG